jgi:hypothetical protein
METRALIVKMLESIQDERVLMRIYKFVLRLYSRVTSP